MRFTHTARVKRKETAFSGMKLKSCVLRMYWVAWQLNSSPFALILEKSKEKRF